MPKVSVIILTKNRPELLKKAVSSALQQSYNDFEVVVLDDGSTDNTQEVLRNTASVSSVVVVLKRNDVSYGITKSRNIAMNFSQGEFIAFLDDDDEWVDKDKLKKQVEWFESHPQGVLVGGAIEVKNENLKKNKYRPASNFWIQSTMLFRNNFFTSTVMFRRQKAIDVGAFLEDGIDLAEDYDLWLRLGQVGTMGNFSEVFTKYTIPDYNKAKFKLFLRKQLYLIDRYKHSYPGYFFASIILRIRLVFLSFF